MDRTRAVLAETQLPKALWAEIINTVVYLKNRSPTTANKDSKTPWEVWNSTKPALGHLRALGCAAYHHLPKPGQKKLDTRSQKCYLLGYEGSNQYRLWDTIKKTVIRSRDVVFDESNLRYTQEAQDEAREGILPVLEETRQFQEVQNSQQQSIKAEASPDTDSLADELAEDNPDYSIHLERETTASGSSYHDMEEDSSVYVANAIANHGHEPETYN